MFKSITSYWGAVGRFIKDGFIIEAVHPWILMAGFIGSVQGSKAKFIECVETCVETCVENDNDSEHEFPGTGESMKCDWEPEDNPSANVDDKYYNELVKEQLDELFERLKKDREDSKQQIPLPLENPISAESIPTPKVKAKAKKAQAPAKKKTTTAKAK